MVREGVFGVEADGRVAPKLPVALVPMLFGTQARITLDEGGRRYVLVRPAQLDGELLVAGKIDAGAKETTVQLVASRNLATSPPQPAERFAPATPAAPKATRHGDAWTVSVPDGHVLWRDGVAQPAGYHTAQAGVRRDHLPAADPARGCAGVAAKRRNLSRREHAAGWRQRLALDAAAGRLLSRASAL